MSSKKAKTADELLSDLIVKVAEITKRTHVQDELLRLHAIPKDRRSPNDKKAYEALLKLVRSNFRADDAMKAVNSLPNWGDAKKKRNHQLIELGGLVVCAGMDSIGPEVLAGMLVGMKKRFNILTSDSQGEDAVKSNDAKRNLEKYKDSGISLMAERDALNEKNRAEKKMKAVKAKADKVAEVEKAKADKVAEVILDGTEGLV